MSASPRAAEEIQGLLLDFGGVISTSPFEQMEEAEQRLGLAPGSLAWRGPLAPATDPLWRAMQAGELSEPCYWAARAREVGGMLGASWSVREFMRRLRPADPNGMIRPEALATIGAARRRGLHVGILTNELELLYGRALLAKLDVLAEMDCIVDATHTGILKPRPEAYGLGVAALGTAPGATLFVDDQWRNIEGAARVGMQVEHFDIRAPGESYRRVNRRLAPAARPTRPPRPFPNRLR